MDNKDSTNTGSIKYWKITVSEIVYLTGKCGLLLIERPDELPKVVNWTTEKI